MNATTNHLFVVGSLTSQLTTWIGTHGAYAVFAIMASTRSCRSAASWRCSSPARSPRARSPARSRSSSATSCRPGRELHRPPLAGTLGYLTGALVGWAIGRRGGRPLLERHGRWLHIDARDARPRRALVRPPRARRRLPRPPHAAGPILHLGPGRRAGEPARAVHGPHARRVGDLVLRVRGRGVGARLQLREGPPRLPLRRHRRRRSGRRRGRRPAGPVAEVYWRR